MTVLRFSVFRASVTLILTTVMLCLATIALTACGDGFATGPSDEETSTPLIIEAPDAEVGFTVVDQHMYFDRNSMIVRLTIRNDTGTVLDDDRLCVMYEVNGRRFYPNTGAEGGIVILHSDVKSSQLPIQPGDTFETEFNYYEEWAQFDDIEKSWMKSFEVVTVGRFVSYDYYTHESTYEDLYAVTSDFSDDQTEQMIADAHAAAGV